MKKSIYLLLFLIVVLATAIACKSNTMSNFSGETGLIDEATGKVWTNGFVKTDTVTATEETIRGYTNAAPVKEIITQYVQGEKEYIIKYVTNETVAQLPDKPGAKYRISVLWTEGGAWEFDVDYRDTAKLNKLWLGQINREGAKDGRVFAIRNGRNPYGIEDFQKSLPAKDENGNLEDYYYFDSKGDIYYKPDNRLIKQFVGAVIVDYVNCTAKRYGWADSVTHEYAHTGNWTVGAIYKMAIGGSEAERIYGSGGSAKNAVHTFIEANITLSKFWNGVHGENIYFKRQFSRGYLEVLVMNPQANEGLSGSAGVDSYYWWGEVNERNLDNRFGRMQDASLYIGKKPQELVKTFTRYVKFTDSWNTPWWNYMFIPGSPN